MNKFILFVLLVFFIPMHLTLSAFQIEKDRKTIRIDKVESLDFSNFQVDKFIFFYNGDFWSSNKFYDQFANSNDDFGLSNNIHLKAIEFYGIAGRVDNFLKKTYLPQLESLTFALDFFQVKDFDWTFLSQSFPHLKRLVFWNDFLSLNLLENIRDLEQLEYLELSIYPDLLTKKHLELLSHLVNLKELKINISQWYMRERPNLEKEIKEILPFTDVHFNWEPIQPNGGG